MRVGLELGRLIIFYLFLELVYFFQNFSKIYYSNQYVLKMTLYEILIINKFKAIKPKYTLK